MSEQRPARPWLQVWRDWLDALPLRDGAVEPELSARAFGADEPVKSAAAPAQSGNDHSKSQSTVDARPRAK